MLALGLCAHSILLARADAADVDGSTLLLQFIFFLFFAQKKSLEWPKAVRMRFFIYAIF